MSDGLADVTLWRWLAAVSPIVVLVALVLRARWSLLTDALVAGGLAAVVATTVYGAGPHLLVVALAKGLWTGLWICYVVWPALLVYQLARRAGLADLGAYLAGVMPRPVESVLLVAWILPSFIQGVAGFGTPIAVAAPLLMAVGAGPVRSIALPLVGYHWAVTFGSMGSSFYMGALTAGADEATTREYASRAAVMLGLNAVVAGVAVALMWGGRRALREGAGFVAVAGATMAGALVVGARIEPSIGSLTAGAAGLGVAAARVAVARRSRAIRPPDPPGADGPGGGAGGLVVLAPYLYLLVLVMVVLVPPGSRAWAKSHLEVGPSFGPTSTDLGFTNPAVDRYTPIELAAHPGSYILVAAGLGALTYRAAGRLRRGRPADGVLRSWVAQSRRATPAIVAFATLATVLAEPGMVRAIAVGAAEVTGGLFPVLSPLVGALGSFMTGSTTSSNALFSGLQADVARLIGAPEAVLLAAQTAGGNVGNSLAPVVALVGATAVGARDEVPAIFRAVLVPGAVLLGILSVVSALWAAAS